MQTLTEELVAALAHLTPLAERFFKDYAPDANTDFACGHAIRRARAALARYRADPEALLRENGAALRRKGEALMEERTD